MGPARTQQHVDLIENDSGTAVQAQGVAREQLLHSAGGRHHHVDALRGLPWVLGLGRGVQGSGYLIQGIFIVQGS